MKKWVSPYGVDAFCSRKRVSCFPVVDFSVGALAFVAASSVVLARTAPSQPGVMSSPELREMMQKHHQSGMMPMTGHPGMQAGLSTPTMPGQDAFGAIQEIVRNSRRRPKPDWSKIDLEGLRQHLIGHCQVNRLARKRGHG
jgi:hypothetical protein